MSEKDEHYSLRSIFFTPCREVLHKKPELEETRSIFVKYVIKQYYKLISLGEIRQYKHLPLQSNDNNRMISAQSSSQEEMQCD